MGTEGKRQDDFSSVCSQCRTEYDCCHGTRPPITKKRQEIIEAYVRRVRMPIADAFVKEEYVFPRENEQGYCVFHDMKTRGCMIHAVKPETCVAGPITFDIDRKTGKTQLFMKKETICRLAALVYEDKKALAKHLESAKKEFAELIGALDHDALEAILKKDEPETFRIA